MSAPRRSVATPGRRDFPFYRGAPRNLTLARWMLAFAMCAVAFGALELIAAAWRGPWGMFAAMAAFGGCNIVGLVLAAGADWTAVFRRLTGRDVLIGLGGALLTTVASGVAGFAVLAASQGAVAGNPILKNLPDLHGPALALFVAGSAIQLLGEEVFTVLPFLALLTWGHKRLGLSRPAAIAVAWIGSSLIFAAAHLPTYQWHVVQTLATIGVARLVLTVPYLLTKNLWSSTIAHVLNDWGLFALATALAALPHAPL